MSERLRELAEKATPGPWTQGRGDEFQRWIDAANRVIVETVEPRDAAYIASASPDVVLRLLRIEEAARRLLDVMPERLSNMQLANLRDALQEDSHVGK